MEELEKDCVPPDQVKSIIDQWNSPKTQEVSRRNAQNISQYKFHHRLGRMPILELEKEFLAEGKVPSKIDIFVSSRARNGKPPVNEHTSGRINTLIDKATQEPEGERTREYDERVWIEEMGVDGHGRVRAAGQGVKPSKHHHSYASSLNDAIKEKIREELREELKEEMRGEMYQMRREMEQMREEREQMRGFTEQREIDQMKREMEQMREEREQMRGLVEQMAQGMARAQLVTSQARNEMTQEVVEEVVSYFGLGKFPTAPFRAPIAPFRAPIAPLRAPTAPLRPFPSSFKPFDMRHESSTYGASASGNSSDL